jgi:GTP-binding protein YchF
LKAGIIGLPGSGKWTVFEALSRTVVDPARKGESRIATVAVPDERVDALSALYKPRKTTYAQVQYFLPGVRGQDVVADREAGAHAQVRDCDALLAVLHNFDGVERGGPTPAKDLQTLDEEMVFADLLVAEKRIERIERERDRNRAYDAEELAVLEACREKLEEGVPLRRVPELAASPHLRSYSFLSAKPLLALANNHDEDGDLPDLGASGERERCAVIRGRLEHELAQMNEDEAAEFSEEYGIADSALGRAIRLSYELLGLVSFFTVGPDEVRAWTVPAGTPADRAAGAIHSDLERGFIRAETVAYGDLVAAGSHAEARKRGLVRLEGKAYEVRDGDIMDVRFSV